MTLSISSIRTPSHVLNAILYACPTVLSVIAAGGNKLQRYIILMNNMVRKSDRERLVYFEEGLAMK